MTNSREVTELDLRMPEFRNPDLKLKDLEFREDGKVVRKDRWETGLRRIASRISMPTKPMWDIVDVVAQVEKLVAENNQFTQQGYVIQNKNGLYLSNGDEYEFIDSLSNAEYFQTAADAQDYIVHSPKQLEGCMVKHAKAKLAFDIKEAK